VLKTGLKAGPESLSLFTDHLSLFTFYTAMFYFIRNFFKSKPQVDFKELMSHGAQLIDVRTQQEYEHGHLQGSVNVPLQQLASSLKRIKKDKPVITYCASGTRSAAATKMLKVKGYTEVYNGGGWKSLEQKIK
jgi:phage shock protein E